MKIVISIPETAFIIKALEEKADNCEESRKLSLLIKKLKRKIYEDKRRRKAEAKRQACRDTAVLPQQ